jgi:galactose mutarotase-like enzyme
MPFSLGAHPAFNCPLDKSKARKDYSLLFDKRETAYSRCLDDQGLIDDRKKLVLNEEDTLRLTDDLFDEDALIFQDLRSENVSLIDRDGNKVWTFGFSGFPYLGIWSQKGAAPFVCIEPWHGLADTADASGHIFEKEGIRTLEAASSFSCMHSITIH